MNRSKIEWCDYTWNPITGCRHNCYYCYARKMTARFAGNVRLNMMAKEDYYTQESKDGSGPVFILEKPMLNETGHVLAYPFGFEPTFHRYRLNTLDKLKMGSNIFVGAMADMFGAWVPDEWIRAAIESCIARPQHNYLFLTKNPERYLLYGVPTGLENMWYGTSITRKADMCRLDGLPTYCKVFISMEPILEDLNPKENWLLFEITDWIIIGAETGRNKGKTVPELDWIEKIVTQAYRAGVPVFMKDSLIPIVGEENMLRDIPLELQKKRLSKKMERKLYGNCASCKTNKRKSDMIAMLARAKRGEMPKQLGFLCKDCFEIICKQLALDMPDLEHGGKNDE